MIKVSVMYPNKPDVRFDHDYYRDKHMPLVKARMGDACKYYTIDKGLAGGAPGAPATDGPAAAEVPASDVLSRGASTPADQPSFRPKVPPICAGTSGTGFAPPRLSCASPAAPDASSMGDTEATAAPP